MAKLYLPAGILSGFDMSAFLDYGYIGVFVITVLGGTFFPVGSPAVVTAAGAMGMPKLPVIFIAALGYTIGTYVNYMLAYEFGIHYVKKKIGVEVYKDLSRWWNKKALILILLFALLPMLPFNLLALLCGVFRYNIIYFLLINFGSNLLNSYLFVYLGSSAGSWIGLF
ncbi:MAG: VTT domain-containing protein [Candidatus Aenigmarchaeota archaeon]|nr:VTT domain-containing protein [Candidatus Aenigmarchaeota archaeon]